MPGDLEGNVEHNECAVHTGQFCRVFGTAGVAPTGRVCVLFPDAEERDTAAAGRDELRSWAAFGRALEARPSKAGALLAVAAALPRRVKHGKLQPRHHADPTATPENRLG